ncbi:MAG: anti-sigma factor family protein, partial [Gaiellaceae bacterium]
QETVSILLFAINGSHGETARSISEYAEGELTGYRRWRVARHLERCEKCQALYRSFLTTLESLRGLGREEPPPDPAFAAQVLERLRDEGRDDAG